MNATVNGKANRNAWADGDPNYVTRWSVISSNDRDDTERCLGTFDTPEEAQAFAQGVVAEMVADGAGEDSEAGLWSVKLDNGTTVLLHVTDVVMLRSSRMTADKIVGRMLAHLETESAALFNESLTLPQHLRLEAMAVDDQVAHLIEQLRHLQGQLRTR